MTMGTESRDFLIDSMSGFFCEIATVQESCFSSFQLSTIIEKHPRTTIGQRDIVAYAVVISLFGIQLEKL
jgi:hypothetical protein